jgi:hypothetical protein
MIYERPLSARTLIFKMGSIWQTDEFEVVLKRTIGFREPEKLPNAQDYPAFHSRKCPFLPPFSKVSDESQECANRT